MVSSHGTESTSQVCDPDLVRAQIAPVFQDYARYLLTIRQAIGLGDVARLDDDTSIVSAAEAVRAHGPDRVRSPRSRRPARQSLHERH